MPTRTVPLDGQPVEISFTDTDGGAVVLLLHGGGGPATVAGFGERFAADRHARVLVPRHPGFDGTPRPPWLTSIRDLARLYTALPDELDLRDVTVVGNSIGGWWAPRSPCSPTRGCGPPPCPLRAHRERGPPAPAGDPRHPRRPHRLFRHRG
jgi:hypothetical protein